MEAEYARLTARAAALGVRIILDPSPPDHARFVGVFEGHTVTLFPNASTLFQRWFTVAHLYGHMVQLASPSLRTRRAAELVYRLGEALDEADIQLIYDHEREAAEIGRALIGPLEPALDRRYARFFHADFHYLINAIETSDTGPAAFDRYYKREPLAGVIAPDPRPLVDLAATPPSRDRVVIL